MNTAEAIAQTQGEIKANPTVRFEMKIGGIFICIPDLPEAYGDRILGCVSSIILVYQAAQIAKMPNENP